MIGREDAMNAKLTKALHDAAKRLGDYTPIRDSERGRWFEVDMGDGRVMRVNVLLDRVDAAVTAEQEPDRG